MDKNTKTVSLIFAVVAVMTVLSFASVPLYDLFCRVTGLSGTTQVSQSAPNEIIDRNITVRFNSDVSASLPWSFKPEVNKMTVKVGQEGLISFVAKNKTKTPTAGTAVYNVTPLKMGKYFHKTQCFCFDEQVLEPNESIHMPVSFFIDPSIIEDQGLEDVKNVTLSYSFYPADSEELDEALEAFYNSEEPATQSSQ